MRVSPSPGRPVTCCLRPAPLVARLPWILPRLLALLCLLIAAGRAPAQAPQAERVTLSPENFAEYAPAGPHAAAVMGDWVLRNKHLVATIANPAQTVGRNSTRLGLPLQGGCVLDLTPRQRQNDHLLTYYPGTLNHGIREMTAQEHFKDSAQLFRQPGQENASGEQVELTIKPPAWAGGPKPAGYPYIIYAEFYQRQWTPVDIIYTLQADAPYLSAELRKENTGKKPLTLNTVSAVYTQTPGLERGLALNNRLYWEAMVEQDEALGVFAVDHTLRIAGNKVWNHNTFSVGQYVYFIRPGSSQPGQFVIAPGETLSLRRHLIPGSSLFEVMAVARDLLGEKQFPVHLSVTDERGPVAHVLVSAFQGEALYAKGRTDEAGRLNTRLPAGEFRFEVTAPGQAAQVLQIKPAETQEYQLRLPSAALLQIRVTDEAGGPIPCTIHFEGRGQTPNPTFGPADGDTHAGNRIYSRSGRIDQAAPPGQYDVIVTRGPEYEALVQRVELQAGQAAEVAGVLAKVVDSAGWISADLHQLTSRSGISPGVFATASPRGRVLSLLAQGIEFAPSTDQNIITDLSRPLAELDAKGLLATTPGVRLTWENRKYAYCFITAFPLPYQHGQFDGGMLQRPQHVQTLTWVSQWNPAGEKVVILDYPPRTLRNFLSDRTGDGVPDAGYYAAFSGEAHALDVQDLTAVLGDDAAARVHQWLDALRIGHRLPGVAGSGAHDNLHRVGAQRTYLQLGVDQPADIKLPDVVQAIRKGHMILTTGPFLSVELCDSQGKSLAGPGDECQLPGGKGSLRVRVQAPSWMDVSKVDVLLDGVAQQRTSYSAAAHPDLFKKGPGALRFDAAVELALERDQFIVVIASGTPPAAAEGAVLGVLGQPQVALSNPIWVDVDGAGAQPLSPEQQPLGINVTIGSPLTAGPKAAPCKVRVNLTNRTRQPLAGELVLQSTPAGIVQYVGQPAEGYQVEIPAAAGRTRSLPARRVVGPSIRYELKPREEIVYELEVALEPGRHPGALWFFVPRAAQGITHSATGTPAPVRGYAIPLLKELAGPAAVAAALAEVTPWQLRTAAGQEAGTVRLAVAGKALALMVDLPAAKAVTLFASTRDRDSIQPYHAFFPVVPPSTRTTTIVNLLDRAHARQVRATSSGAGQRIVALLPLDDLRLSDALQEGKFLFEMEALGAAAEAATLFGSPRPRETNDGFATLRIGRSNSPTR